MMQKQSAARTSGFFEGRGWGQCIAQHHGRIRSGEVLRNGETRCGSQHTKSGKEKLYIEIQFELVRWLSG